MDAYRLWQKLNTWQRVYFFVLVNLRRRVKRMVVASLGTAILAYWLLCPDQLAFPVASLAGFYAALGAMLI